LVDSALLLDPVLRREHGRRLALELGRATESMLVALSAELTDTAAAKYETVAACQSAIVIGGDGCDGR
jgi:hypothetical protein